MLASRSGVVDRSRIARGKWITEQQRVAFSLLLEGDDDRLASFSDPVVIVDPPPMFGAP